MTEEKKENLIMLTVNVIGIAFMIFLLFVIAPNAKATEEVYQSDLANSYVLYCDGKAAWDTCHHAATADSASQITANSTSNIVHASKYGTNDWYLRRSELNFDTSALPDDAIIDSAVLTLWSAGTGGSDGDGFELDLLDLTNNANIQNPLATEDMNDLGVDVIGTKDLTSLYNIGANVNIDITDLTVISLNADTRIGLQMSGDTDDTTPTGVNILRISTGSAGDDPYLTINYHQGTTGTASTTTIFTEWHDVPIYQLDPVLTFFFLFYKTWWVWAMLFGIAYVLRRVGQV